MAIESIKRHDVFIYRPDDAPKRSLGQLQAAFVAEGIKCRVEHLDDGPWFVLDGDRIDMSVTVEDDGNASSVMVQIGDGPPDELDRLFSAFTRLGWEVADV